jgi:RNase E specificity factor CsrD
MIKRNIRYFGLFLTILTLFFVWVLKLDHQSSAELNFKKHSNNQSTILSSISLLQVNYDIANRQGLSGFLQGISNIADIQEWQLLDSQGKVIQSRQSLTKQTSVNFNHIIYLKNAANGFLTLKVAIAQPKQSNEAISGTDFIYTALFVFLVLLLGGYHFKWLYQLESYARYILANDNKPGERNLKKSTNPISQTINQLILKNSLLLKEKNELTDQIRKISFIDESTELGNQLFFKAEFEVRLHNHEEPESGLVILMSFAEVDLQENSLLDSERLKAIANLLRHFVAEIPNAIVARLKDFDFALLLPNQTREKTDNLCKSLITQLDKTIFDHTNIREHFVDIGISAYKQGFDYYKILAEADMALRNAQLQGGNSWFMYGESLSNSKVRGKLKWRSFLQRVLDKRQVQLFAQEIVYLDKVAKANNGQHIEIYSRIKDGDEVLTADTFLPMASQCGLAIEFDRQVVDGVIKHCLYQSQETTDTIYSINLFISSLLDEKFVSWLIAKLSSYPALCHQLCFEIKEAHINHHLARLNIVFSQLAKLGVSWSIEKFGSPEEEQAFLDLLPISRVKIDRRIINNIHSDKSQQLFLQSLLINLKGKKIEVFADGVEKEADAIYLKDSGITGAQGYYYAKPERLKRVENYLRVV